MKTDPVQTKVMNLKAGDLIPGWGTVRADHITGSTRVRLAGIGGEDYTQLVGHHWDEVPVIR